jgi:uncharacterized protein
LKIDVRGLIGSPGEQRHYDLTVPVPLAKMSGQAVRFEPARLHMVLTSTPKGILASGNLSSAARLQCGRCLVEFEQVLEDRFEHLFMLSEPPSSHHQAGGPRRVRAGEVLEDDEDEEVLGEGEEMDVSPIVDGQIDLSPIVAAVLDLAMPMKPLCRPDCQGLCSMCGHPLNEGPCNCEPDIIDPRLGALAKLLPKQPVEDGLGQSDSPADDARTKERK